MKYFRCILSSIIAIFLCMSAFTGTATAVENNSPPIDVTTCQTNPIELTDEQQDTLNKIVSVGTHFKYVDNQLIITLNESELKNTYGFSESQYTFLQDTVLGATHADNTSFARVPASPSGAMAKCDGWYIPHSDLTVGIATAITVAAGIGPEALAAALTALGTTVGGPAGTIAGILVSAVGTLYLANLALQITRAIATGKGICLTIAIPPGVSVQ